MKKINKRTARKMFENREDFIIVACLVRPEHGIYLTGARMAEYDNFDQLVNIFTYYNCDCEQGRYPAFYIA